jgi:hypothetical protein
LKLKRPLESAVVLKFVAWMVMTLPGVVLVPVIASRPLARVAELTVSPLLPAWALSKNKSNAKTTTKLRKFKTPPSFVTASMGRIATRRLVNGMSKPIASGES